MTDSDVSSLTPSSASSLKRWLNPVIKTIADLRLAIILLLMIAVCSISGTVIEQGETVAFYQENYPEDPALFGFLSWKVILLLGLDHVYRTWWFLSLLTFFSASLTACTFTRQLPALKAARKWKFYTQARQFEKLALSADLAVPSLELLMQTLEKRSFKVFQEGDMLYARKGMIGRIGPILVHASMLLILGGAIWGSLTGFLAQEMIPSGQTFQVRNIIRAGPLAQRQIPKDWGIKVNRFWIDYTPQGNIDQFYSDLSVVEERGEALEEVDRETIYVNKPLRHKGVTFYQTDWSIAGVVAQINKSPVLQFPMAQLDTGGAGRLWGGFIPTKPDMSEGVSLLTRDLQGTLMVYDVEGQLVGATRPGLAMEVNGVTLKIYDLIGSTGLQIKADPGIPFVYAGFALLMLGVMMSYVSHSQIWALRSGDRFYLGGKTNRAQVTFEREFVAIAEQLQHERTHTTDWETSSWVNAEANADGKPTPDLP